MRVIFLTHNYPRWSGDVAGGFLHPLAQAIRAHGVALQVIAPADAGRGGAEVLDGVPIERVRYGTPTQEHLAYTGRMQEALGSPRGWLAFGRLIRAMRAATRRHAVGGDRVVVHAHWWLPAGLASPTELPLVLTCHGTDVRLLQRLPGATLLARPIFRRARVVSTVSTALADVLRQQVGREVPAAAVQPMPIQTIARPLTRGGGGWVVVGRLTNQKRIELAIAALALHRRHGGTATLTIAGGGPAHPALEVLAEAEGVADAVRFLGPQSPTEVAELLATADIFLMPAREEGFGLAAAEALIQGVPVIACEDGGGLREIVIGAGGQIVPPTAADILAAVLALTGNSTARQAAATLGEHWRERLAVDQVAARCLAWYAEALA